MLRASIFSLAFIAMSGAASAQQAQQPAPPDPGRMSRQELRDELTQLRAIVGNGAVRPFRPAGCTSYESRQFDFWLGEWDVSGTGTQAVVAESSISVRDQGCVIMEEWRPLRGGHGHSINFYDPTDQKWHQTWGAASGTFARYAGSFADGVMRLENLSGAPGASPGTRARMNFQALDENTVRQWGEQHDAASDTWTTQWDLTYRRRPGTR